MNNTPTIKLTLENRGNNPKQPLKIRITYRGDHRLYAPNTDIKLTKDEFQNDKLKITKIAKEAAEPAINIAKAVVSELGTKFTFKEFTRQYRKRLYGEHSDVSLFSVIAEDYIKGLYAENTKGSYRTAVKWVERYRAGIHIGDIDKDFLMGLQDFIRANGKEKGKDTSENTIRLYLRNIKAIYNRGVQVLNIQNQKPFIGVKTGSIGRQKVALDIDEFKSIVDYKPQNITETMGKDFFILTFALSGANCKDILLLKNKDIDLPNNQVVFIREKTKETGIDTIVPLTSHALKILNKYGNVNPDKPNEYVLPYLANCTSERAINNKNRDVLKKVNAGLAMITSVIGMSKITTYTARHTFASLALHKGDMSREQIQKFLGHASASTTEAYLKSITRGTIKKNKDFIEDTLK